MKVNELRVQERVGQYWLNKVDGKVRKIASFGEILGGITVNFEDGIYFDLPLKDNFVYLWNRVLISPEYFKPYGEVREGQVWVIGDELIFVCDNWKDAAGGWITMMSDGCFDIGSNRPVLYQNSL
jgi:hypothetical protein